MNEIFKIQSYYLSFCAFKEQTNQTRQFRLKDINLLKVILCSGLYPQLAIADPHNSHKADSEQMYHTKASNRHIT